MKSALLALLLAGCASADVVCDQRVGYEHQTAIQPSGDIRLIWRVAPQAPRVWGNTQCFQTSSGTICDITLRHAQDFNNTCDLALLGHELTHAMGATHER